jgi:hypothetical protein
VTFTTWSSAYPGVTNPSIDTDSDGLCDGLEYALAGNPLIPSVLPQPTVAIQQLLVAGVEDKYLTMTFRRLFDPGDVIYEIQYSDDLVNWSSNGVVVGDSLPSNGTCLEIWRSPAPVSATKFFARLKTTFKVP